MAKWFAEFFAGVGLVHEGLSSDGWQCVWANDISQDKRDTYVANFGADHFILGDVWDYVTTPQTIPDDCFLYTASFPCTDLSLAGERRGLAGTESGTLKALLEILRLKHQARSHPTVIMLENVPGFLTSNNGADLTFTVQSLNDLGYIVDLIELDAIHFSPQSRPRVFLFGFRDDAVTQVLKRKNATDLFDAWWMDFNAAPMMRTQRIRRIISENPNLSWGLVDIPQPPVRTCELADIIDTGLEADSSLWWSPERQEHLRSQMKPAHLESLDRLVENDVFSYGTVYRRMREGGSRAELRVDGNAGCLRTPRGGSSKQILIRAGFGSWKVRLLTPREYARLQGVRDSFILPQKSDKGYFAMGDAVCVPAISFLSRHVLTPVYESTLGASGQVSASSRARKERPRKRIVAR